MSIKFKVYIKGRGGSRERLGTGGRNRLGFTKGTHLVEGRKDSCSRVHQRKGRRRRVNQPKEDQNRTTGGAPRDGPDAQPRQAGKWDLLSFVSTLRTREPAPVRWLGLLRACRGLHPRGAGKEAPPPTRPAGCRARTLSRTLHPRRPRRRRPSPSNKTAGETEVKDEK